MPILESYHFLVAVLITTQFIPLFVQGERLNKFVSHFELLNYDTDSVHSQHIIHKRSIGGSEKSSNQNHVLLQFSALGKDFNLKLARDRTILSKDFQLVTSDGAVDYDTSFLYRGEDEGVAKSFVHGSIIDGKFEGRIQHKNEQYYIEPSGRHLNKSTESQGFHSVIYRHSDVEFPDRSRGGAGGGGGGHYCDDDDETARWMKSVQNSAVEKSKPRKKPDIDDHESPSAKYSRAKRTADGGKFGKRANEDTCSLYIQADHLYTAYYDDSYDSVVTQITNHVNVLNTVFNDVNFDGYSGIGFVISRVRVNDSSDLTDPYNPFVSSNIGVAKLLDLLSDDDHSKYCLAFLFTYRDFSDGVLGLAWVGSNDASGGICEQYKLYADQKYKSLNTGVVTILNYGYVVSTAVSQLTLAHEVGHSFGSPHDYPADCTPGGSEGNYLMYAMATSADKVNNDEFSDCSISNISVVLTEKISDCFISSDRAQCGNAVVEDGEVCDCGYEDSCGDLGDSCCNPANDDDDTGCTLKDNTECSPTQGPCCTDSCTLVVSSDNQTCDEEDECHYEAMCNGVNATCPDPDYKEDNVTECHSGTKVCYNGECVHSICIKYGKAECSCTSDGTDDDKLCHVCCQDGDDETTCQSTMDLSEFNYTEIMLTSGSPCNDYTGYCDFFDKCREVDSNGPLARLKDAIFNPETYEDFVDWIENKWWATLLICLAFVILMGAFIKCCAVHTPSQNPRMPAARQLTLPRTLSRRRPQNPRQPAPAPAQNRRTRPPTGRPSAPPTAPPPTSSGFHDLAQYFPSEGNGPPPYSLGPSHVSAAHYNKYGYPETSRPPPYSSDDVEMSGMNRYPHPQHRP